MGALGGGGARVTGDMPSHSLRTDWGEHHMLVGGRFRQGNFGM